MNSVNAHKIPHEVDTHIPILLKGKLRLREVMGLAPRQVRLQLRLSGRTQVSREEGLRSETRPFYSVTPIPTQSPKEKEFRSAWRHQGEHHGKRDPSMLSCICQPGEQGLKAGPSACGRTGVRDSPGGGVDRAGQGRMQPWGGWAGRKRLLPTNRGISGVAMLILSWWLLCSCILRRCLAPVWRGWLGERPLESDRSEPDSGLSVSTSVTQTTDWPPRTSAAHWVAARTRQKVAVGCGTGILCSEPGGGLPLKRVL